VCARYQLRGDAEDRVDELALREGVAFRNPTDLTFADCMHRIVALDHSSSTLHRSESEARCNPLLYEPRVLLDHCLSKVRFREYRKYHGTHRKMITSSKCSPRNKCWPSSGRATPYQIGQSRICNNIAHTRGDSANRVPWRQPHSSRDFLKS
jgi:hypothetical protein